ncbi:MAG: excinuclease ABC subunit UvrC, partial [Puniceicoccales bacterium]|nr:excinuclease ABC subunit UvrC [Puniceicoccales bacterium]
DEAHRFANGYNADLRSKKIRESVLDDCPGLGEKRRAALLEHFKSLPRLKKATVEELAEVSGIGKQFAETIAAFLEKMG